MDCSPDKPERLNLLIPVRFPLSPRPPEVVLYSLSSGCQELNTDSPTLCGAFVPSLQAEKLSFPAFLEWALSFPYNCRQKFTVWMWRVFVPMHATEMSPLFFDGAMARYFFPAFFFIRHPSPPKVVFFSMALCSTTPLRPRIARYIRSNPFKPPGFPPHPFSGKLFSCFAYLPSLLMFATLPVSHNPSSNFVADWRLLTRGSRVVISRVR